VARVRKARAGRRPAVRGRHSSPALGTGAGRGGKGLLQRARRLQSAVRRPDGAGSSGCVALPGESGATGDPRRRPGALRGGARDVRGERDDRSPASDGPGGTAWREVSVRRLVPRTALERSPRAGARVRLRAGDPPSPSARLRAEARVTWT